MGMKTSIGLRGKDGIKLANHGCSRVENSWRSLLLNAAQVSGSGGALRQERMIKAESESRQGAVPRVSPLKKIRAKG